MLTFERFATLLRDDTVSARRFRWSLKLHNNVSQASGSICRLLDRLWCHLMLLSGTRVREQNALPTGKETIRAKHAQPAAETMPGGAIPSSCHLLTAASSRPHCSVLKFLWMSLKRGRG